MKESQLLTTLLLCIATILLGSAVSVWQNASFGLDKDGSSLDDVKKALDMSLSLLGDSTETVSTLPFSGLFGEEQIQPSLNNSTNSMDVMKDPNLVRFDNAQLSLLRGQTHIVAPVTRLGGGGVTFLKSEGKSSLSCLVSSSSLTSLASFTPSLSSFTVYFQQNQVDDARCHCLPGKLKLITV